MKCVIEINMDNAAFEDQGGIPELSRVIRNALDQMERGQDLVNIRDINGNIVGALEITD